MAARFSFAPQMGILRAPENDENGDQATDPTIAK